MLQLNEKLVKYFATNYKQFTDNRRGRKSNVQEHDNIEQEDRQGS